MINWQLSKQGIHWPVAPDRIAGSRLTHRGQVLFEVIRWQVTSFQTIAGSSSFLKKKCIGNTLCLWAAVLQCNMLSLVLENWARSILIVDTTCKLSNQHSTWKTKNQLCNFSLHFEGLFLFHYNYDIKEIHISSKFYSELLQWWSEFRSVFDSRRECQYILWNNKEIRVDNKPVFYKKIFFWTRCHFRLLFELDTTNSFTIVSNKISKMNYLIWAGLRHSVPKHHSNCLCSEISLILTIDNKEFDLLEKRLKDYYMLIKRIIAQCPKNSKHLCQDFNLTHSLRASSPIWAAPRSRVLARLSSLAQIGELARRLSNARPAEKSIPSSTWGTVWTLSKSSSIQSP